MDPLCGIIRKMDANLIEKKNKYLRISARRGVDRLSRFCLLWAHKGGNSRASEDLKTLETCTGNETLLTYLYKAAAPSPLFKVSMGNCPKIDDFELSYATEGLKSIRGGGGT